MEKGPQTPKTTEMPEAAAQNIGKSALDMLADLTDGKTNSPADNRLEYIGPSNPATHNGSESINGSEDVSEKNEASEREKTIEMDLPKEFAEAKALAEEVSQIDDLMHEEDLVHFLVDSGLDYVSRIYGAKKVIDAAVKGFDNFTRARRNSKNSFRKDIDEAISGIYKDIQPDAEARKRILMHGDNLDDYLYALSGDDRVAVEYYMNKVISIGDDGEVKILRSGDSNQLYHVEAYEALMYLGKINKAVNNPDSRVFEGVTMDDFTGNGERDESVNSAFYKIRGRVAEAANKARDSFYSINAGVGIKLGDFEKTIRPDSSDLAEAQRIIAGLEFKDPEVSDAVGDFESMLFAIEEQRDKFVEIQVKQKETELYRGMNSSKEEISELGEKMDRIFKHAADNPLYD